MIKGWLSNVRQFWRIDAVGIATAVALTVAAYGLQVQPIIRARQSIVGQTAELRAQMAQVSQLRSSLQSAENDLAAAQQKLTESNLQFEPASQLNQRIAKLTSLAGEDGLQIDSVEPGKIVAGTRYQTMNIRLSGRGPYRSCAQFLRHLSESVRDSSVVRLQLSARNGTVEPTATFAIDLTWYTAPEALSSTR